MKLPISACCLLSCLVILVAQGGWFALVLSVRDFLIFSTRARHPPFFLLPRPCLDLAIVSRRVVPYSPAFPPFLLASSRSHYRPSHAIMATEVARSSTASARGRPSAEDFETASIRSAAPSYSMCLPSLIGQQAITSLGRRHDIPHGCHHKLTYIQPPMHLPTTQLLPTPNRSRHTHHRPRVLPPAQPQPRPRPRAPTPTPTPTRG